MSVLSGEILQQNSGWRGSRELWLDAAYETLINAGVQNVRVLHLAKKLNISRTSFYWFFKDRDELLRALLQQWRDKNTKGLATSTRQPAATISAAVLNVSYCWIEEKAFDCEFEFAVRSWGLSSAKVLAAVQEADAERLKLLEEMFLRYGFEAREADIRARTLYQTQIGYISMRLHLQESLEERLMRMVDYVYVFTGQKPIKKEIDNFYRQLGEKNPQHEHNKDQ